MLTIVGCLLLATAAFAQNGNYMYQGSNLPMDHYDDIHNRDFPSLVYNFEQLRSDQPPQVEVREEDLGRYMYRPRTTTTPPTPTSRIIDFPPQIPEVKILPEPIRPHLSDISTTKPYIGPTWNQIINKHLPATIPPPPVTPQWMDLSDTLKHRDAQPHYNPVHVPQAPVFHQEAVPQMPEHLAQSAYPQYSGVMNTEYVSTTQAPYAHYMQNVPAEQHVQHSAPRAPSQKSRGHHKFSWNDVTPMETTPPMAPRQPVITTPATVSQPSPARRMKMPASIPTLTPWSGDSFGK